MGFKTYTCQICGEQVSKKKSLSLKELESRDGRACKHHDKVQELLEAEEKHQEELEYSKQADENIFVMFCCS